jgi:hypothetical protein
MQLDLAEIQACHIYTILDYFSFFAKLSNMILQFCEYVVKIFVIAYYISYIAPESYLN